jgi:hypothetical protein
MKKVLFSTALLACSCLSVFAMQLMVESFSTCRFYWEKMSFSMPASSPEDILVINEIMYNNPGTDDYEFIELYNSGDLVIQLQGYRFTQGVTFTFPAYELEPGGYVVVAVDSAKFRQAFNVPALQWNSGQALNNSGETITLVKPDGSLVDMVAYDDDMLPWPSQADGFGPSLQLCDPGLDNNNGASWAVSTQPTGFFVSGIQILATPGAANNCAPPPPPSYPIYNIGTVTTNNPQGIPDSIGVTCQLQGVVYGNNLRSGGLQFTLIDEFNDGIHVFSGSQEFGYQVEEGNEVIVRGIIAQFNGLTQIQPDTVILVSQIQPLFPATVVVALNESTESQLVRIEQLSIVDPAQWINSGTGFNVEVTNGTATFQMRIDDNVNIFGTAPPSGPFNLTGIGGQFDSSIPYDEGYQILPRYLSDINLISNINDEHAANLVAVFPNPVRELLQIESGWSFTRLFLTDAMGRVVSDRYFEASTAYRFSVQGLPPGFYQLTIIGTEGKATKKIIIAAD